MAIYADTNFNRWPSKKKINPDDYKKGTSDNPKNRKTWIEYEDFPGEEMTPEDYLIWKEEELERIKREKSFSKLKNRMDLFLEREELMTKKFNKEKRFRVVNKQTGGVRSIKKQPRRKKKKFYGRKEGREQSGSEKYLLEINRNLYRLSENDWQVILDESKKIIGVTKELIPLIKVMRIFSQDYRQAYYLKIKKKLTFKSVKNKIDLKFLEIDEDLEDLVAEIYYQLNK